MEWFLILVASVASVIAFWVWMKNESHKRNERQKELNIAYGEQLREKNRETVIRSETFEKELFTKWPVRYQTTGVRHRKYIMMNEDQNVIRILEVHFHPEVDVKLDVAIFVQSLVSVELQQSNETIMHLETTTETKNEKGSPLLRAAVGGLAFGGFGAVVGAVSAKQTFASTTTTTNRSEIRKGPIYLMMGTTDIQNPLVQCHMPNMQEAEQWLHRIRGAIAVSSRSPAEPVAGHSAP